VRQDRSDTGLRHDRGRHIEWTDTTWDRSWAAPAKARLAATVTQKLSLLRLRKTNNGDMASGSGPAVQADRCHSAPEDRLALPLAWDAPRRILVNALSDLFHESAPIETIDRVFAIMALAHATSSRS